MGDTLAVKRQPDAALYPTCSSTKPPVLTPFPPSVKCIELAFWFRSGRSDRDNLQEQRERDGVTLSSFD